MGILLFPAALTILHLFVPSMLRGKVRSSQDSRQLRILRQNKSLDKKEGRDEECIYKKNRDFLKRLDWLANL